MSRFERAQPWVTTAARVFLAGVWLLAGWLKFIDSGQTIRSVQAYRLLPDSLVRPMAYGLPVFEMLLGLFLLAGLATRFSGIVSALLLVVFIGAIASSWARGLRIDCGCFGGTGEQVDDHVRRYLTELGRDSVFLVASAFVVRWPDSRFAVDRLLRIPTVVDEPDDVDVPA